MQAATSLAPIVGITPSSQALGLARSSYYRHQRLARRDDPPIVAPPRRASPRALDAPERQAVLDVLHSERFQDCSPTEVYATLLDEGVYLASERTFYRLLAASGETPERRDQLVHPAYPKPELLRDWVWPVPPLDLGGVRRWGQPLRLPRRAPGDGPLPHRLRRARQPAPGDLCV